jgi:hypothetical protein
MATNIGNLKVQIGADTKDLARGIGRAKAHMRSFAKVAKVGAVAAAAAFAAAGAGMAMLAKGGLANVDAQAKMARSLDGSIDALRALQLAGADAGVATNDMNTSIQMMGKRLAEAARDGFGPAHEALELLGLDAQELMALDIDARFGAIADAVNGLGLNAAQAADMMRQFGVRSNEVALALLQGSGAIKAARKEVDKFGLSIGTDGAAAVERANDALSRIKLVFESLGNQIAVKLAPMLERVAIDFQEMASVGGPLQATVDALVETFGSLAETLSDPAFINAAVMLGTSIAGAVVGLSNVMVFLVENAELAGSAMVALGGAMLWFSGPIGLAIAAVSAGVLLLSTRMSDAEKAADLAAEAEARLSAALDTLDTSNTDAVASGETLITNHIDGARAAVEAAKAELALARARSTAGNALLDQNRLTADGNSGYAEAMAAQVTAAETALDAQDAQLLRYQNTLEGFKRSQFPSQGTGVGSGVPLETPDDAPAVTTEKFRKELDALIDRLDPASVKLKMMARDHATLAAALMKGEITMSEYTAHMDQLKELYKELPETTSAAAAGIKILNKELSKSPAAQMADEVGGAVGSLIMQIDGGVDALRNFGLELVKIFAIKGIEPDRVYRRQLSSYSAARVTVFMLS